MGFPVLGEVFEECRVQSFFVDWASLSFLRVVGICDFDADLTASVVR